MTDDIEKVARACIVKILGDLTDRKGLEHEWHGIDNDIQCEIISEWHSIIKNEFAGYTPPTEREAIRAAALKEAAEKVAADQWPTFGDSQRISRTILALANVPAGYVVVPVTAYRAMIKARKAN